MSAIGDVRPPEVKPAEQTSSSAASRNEAAARRPALVPTAMEAPEATLMNKPNTAALPLPPEAAFPMSPDNGQAAARAMHMLVTLNVQTTQSLVLTELKTAATHDIKQHDHRREHRSTGRREQMLPVADEDENETPQRRKPDAQQTDDDPSADASADILELLALLQSGEPLQPETLVRVQRFLESGAAALVTTRPNPLSRALSYLKETPPRGGGRCEAAAKLVGYRRFSATASIRGTTVVPWRYASRRRFFA